MRLYTKVIDSQKSTNMTLAAYVRYNNMGQPLPLRAAALRALRAILSIQEDDGEISSKSSSNHSSHSRKQRRKKTNRHKHRHISTSTELDECLQKENIGTSVKALAVQESIDYDGDIIQDVARIIRLRQATNLIKDYLIVSDCPCDARQCWGAICRARGVATTVDEYDLDPKGCLINDRNRNRAVEYSDVFLMNPWQSF
ncbi:hypothetical protein DICVIV_03246 [Dictyocaulus viviparus]|uniref:Uncharacterized protein n=1 Tax=Dictyocaulus viviparus TaxID=29172 RepID=A0A0D8Y317_DICVI|nr:hypothetical protein DICVIV_03246 [Dictyocaulus viviparus]